MPYGDCTTQTPSTAETLCLPVQTTHVYGSGLISSVRNSNGERPFDPRPRYPALLRTAWLLPTQCQQPKHVPRIQHLQQLEKGLASMRARQAVVLQGADWFQPELLPGLQDLRAMGMLLPGDLMLRVLCSDAKLRRFYEVHMGQTNAFTKYHVKDPETTVLSLSVQDALSCASSWTTKQLMFEVCLLTNAASAPRLQLSSGPSTVHPPAASSGSKVQLQGTPTLVTSKSTKFSSLEALNLRCSNDKLAGSPLLMSLLGKQHATCQNPAAGTASVGHEAASATDAAYGQAAEKLCKQSAQHSQAAAANMHKVACPEGDFRPSNCGTGEPASMSIGSHAASLTKQQHLTEGERATQHPDIAASRCCLLAWPGFQSLLQSQRFGAITAVNMEVMCAWDALLPLRYRRTDMFLLQAAGRQRVLLIQPHWAFQGLPPFPVSHLYDGYCMVDWDQSDWQQQWPLAGAAEAQVVILQPGDVLYVPSYMYVQRQSLEVHSVTFRVEVGQGCRSLIPLAQAGDMLAAAQRVPLGPAPWVKDPLSPSMGAATLFVSRIAEEMMADACGTVEHVRDWLLRIGHGIEQQYLRADTTHGYKMLMVCQAIRDCVEAWFGPESWRTLLLHMCDDRLLPTTWLNKHYRDPLYLTDKPVYLPDNRTDEERKYPQLFRQKLRSEGWEVPDPTFTVPTSTTT